MFSVHSSALYHRLSLLVFYSMSGRRELRVFARGPSVRKTESNFGFRERGLPLDFFSSRWPISAGLRRSLSSAALQDVLDLKGRQMQSKIQNVCSNEIPLLRAVCGFTGEQSRKWKTSKLNQQTVWLSHHLRGQRQPVFGFASPLSRHHVRRTSRTYGKTFFVISARRSVMHYVLRT